MKRFPTLFNIAFALMFLLFIGCSKEATIINKQELLMNGIESVSNGAPIIAKDPSGLYVKDSYIVVLNDDVLESEVNTESDRICKQQNKVKNNLFKHALKGFTVKASSTEIDQIRQDSKVKYVEQEQIFSAVVTQSGATWGIDRLDQPNLPLSGTYTYTQTGSTVDAYIFDTGIKLDHTQFGGRAKTGFDAFISGGAAMDGNGHGTHVAGTVGGSTYGIAKGVTLLAVRVLDNAGSGTTGGVVAGLDWAVGNHEAGKLAVGNMSLGGGASTALDDAVRRVITDGIVMCVAAGNSTANAANYSPARVIEAITVGATTSADGIASYSNYGSTVDILAPGSSITSSWYTSTTAINTISGTSMATPHVAGVAALYLEVNGASTTAQVQTALKNFASPNVISGSLNGSPNLLLQSSFSVPPPPTAVPAVPTLGSPANSAVGQSLNLTFTWNAASTATSYDFQISTLSDFSSTVISQVGLTTTSYVASGLTPGKLYYWRVRAKNVVGISDWSVFRSFSTLLSAPTLSSPANASTNISRTPTLIWNASTGATSYKIQYSTTSTFSTATTQTITGVTGTSYTFVTTLAGNTTYYWRVQAVSGTISSTYSGSRRFKTRA